MSRPARGLSNTRNLRILHRDNIPLTSILRKDSIHLRLNTIRKGNTLRRASIPRLRVNTQAKANTPPKGALQLQRHQQQLSPTTASRMAR